MMETNNTKKQINNRTKVTTSVPLSEKKKKTILFDEVVSVGSDKQRRAGGGDSLGRKVGESDYNV